MRPSRQTMRYCCQLIPLQITPPFIVSLLPSPSSLHPSLSLSLFLSPIPLFRFSTLPPPPSQPRRCWSALSFLRPGYKPFPPLPNPPFLTIFLSCIPYILYISPYSVLLPPHTFIFFGTFLSRPFALFLSRALLLFSFSILRFLPLGCSPSDGSPATRRALLHG